MFDGDSWGWVEGDSDGFILLRVSMLMFVGKIGISDLMVFFNNGFIINLVFFSLEISVCGDLFRVLIKCNVGKLLFLFWMVNCL